MVPVSLEDQLVPGTLEYAIHHIVEERLDLSLFDDRYCNDETGRKAIDPKVLIKISSLDIPAECFHRGHLSGHAVKILRLCHLRAGKSLITARYPPLYLQLM
ncbi:MAG: hypothetical protein SWO11_20345 [Thermodesulfobacteriota bacterium]|nr:hypothetical protein [Thermodesulfobacteriota bacterium]